VSRTNTERAAAGLAPLTVDAQLSAAAQSHSQDQANRGVMTHTGSNGSSVADRVTAAGYVWSSVGENVAYGYRTSSSVMDGWMGSPGHRANILTPSFTQIGMGIARTASGTPYWTMVLATR
jgi:uncharacterized protein YkwD